MFTGLIQAVGTIAKVSESSLVVHYEDAWNDDPFDLGESVAVNGCCLTVAGHGRNTLGFALSLETWSRTSFSTKKVGDPINLERAMKASDRFGGHIVQGHVDGVARVVAIRPDPSDFATFTFEVDPECDRFLIDKGSVALDGISLTVIKPVAGRFEVAVIPHTLSQTALGSAEVGDRINVEFDVLAKHVERLLGCPK